MVRLSALDIKLFRDLWRMRAQALAILLITAAGCAAFVTQLGTLHSLEQTMATYYERNRFADLFANVRRAPESRLADLTAIPGVKSATPRIVYNVVLDIAGMTEPVNGLVVSQPRPERGELNLIYIRRGRAVQPLATDEVVLSETFANANHLDVGSQFYASIKGHRRHLTVVGIGLSPEYIFFGVPGAMVPDDRRFGVMWMDRDTLAAAFDMRGAFNDVAIALMPGADASEVIRRVNAVLDPYGGVGAYARKDHVSHATLSGDIAQLRASIRMAAPLFLGVVAFLLNMLMLRQVETERTHIGVLKAFGYTNAQVAWHYAKMVLAIILAGVVVGLLGGAWLGHVVAQRYAASYHFPSLQYVITPAVFVQAAAVQLVAALVGGFGSLRKAVKLPPAVAMRPPPPPVYRRTLIERLGVRVFGDQPTRMILRHLLRWPMRSFLTATAIAAATTLLVAPMAVLDSAKHMVSVHFFQSERQDLTVAFAQTRGRPPALDAMQESPGVLYAEPFRATMANVRFGTKERRITVLGRPGGANELSRPLLASLDPLAIPPVGVVISRSLASWLGATVGDYIELQFMEGRRPLERLPVTAIAQSHVGLTFFMVHMDLDRLNAIMRDGDVISGTHLRVDPEQRDALYAQLKETPSITGVVSHSAQLDAMHRIMAQTTRMTLLFVGFAALIVFGVVYNSARISLAERARELATMRMLGFSRLEVAYILLGELALLTALAVPPGCWAGYWLAWNLTEGASNEMFRLPLFVTKASYGYAVLVITSTVLISGCAVAWRTFRFDLIGILKIRE
ncbi:MAG TPA: FtsX-like permease family protein [Acetobacteraceae bacterium]|nr:FtsX-like permease family protein [Acetobacteraceae bacterium]